MKIIHVNLGNDSYDIKIERGILDKAAVEIKERFPLSKAAVITDENLYKLYGERLKKRLLNAGINTSFIIIKPGEKSKCLHELEMIYGKLCEFSMTRSDIILTFGGGVVGDLGGFAAATYLRGIPYIQIPTSLLAQIDSSIGGKVAIDLPYGKNLVGNFYQPKAVFIDPDILYTLDDKFLKDGLGEVIKTGFIKSRNIIDELLSYKGRDELLSNIDDIIYECCSIKKAVVENDVRDTDERMVLNFGHTIGHAIEKYFNYDKYSHGEAVAMGMRAITKRSEELSITKKGVSGVMKKVMDKYGLKYDMPSVDEEKLLGYVSLDKKNIGNHLNIILLKDIGEAEIKKIDADDIKHYI